MKHLTPDELREVRENFVRWQKAAQATYERDENFRKWVDSSAVFLCLVFDDLDIPDDVLVKEES